MRRRQTSAILLLAGSLQANWPQWRGPDSNGSSKTARGLAVNWTQTDNVFWRTKLPSWSAATPIVWADTVFVTSAEEGFTPLDRGRRSRSNQETLCRGRQETARRPYAKLSDWIAEPKSPLSLRP